MDFKGKNILLISVRFFDYEKAISTRLRELGATVDFFDDRPSNSVLHRGIIRVNRKFLQRTISTYYENILAKISDRKYDYFLLIKGEAIPDFFIRKIKSLNPEMQTICYTYDSIKEHPHFKNFFLHFDRKFTFDPKDAAQYGIYFRPLFFLDVYQKFLGISGPPEFDVVFIGSAHTDRYLLGEKVKTICNRLHLRSFFYYYSPGKAAFRLKKIFDPNFKKFDLRKVSFKKLSHRDIAAYYQRTKAVLDLNKPYQTGLTMRTFEVLASGRKLITPNASVVHYPFYDPQNILVIQRDHIQILPEFFDTGFKEIDENVRYMMSLDSWLECLFIKDQDEYWKTK